MILILGGIRFRIAEIIKLEKAVTMVTERAITKAGFNCAVTAKEEQTPNICTKTGLSLLKGPKYFLILIIISLFSYGFIL